MGGNRNAAYDGESQGDFRPETVPTSPSEMGVMQKFAYYRDLPFTALSKHPLILKSLVYGVLFILYNAYFIYCLVRREKHGFDFEWCDGLGFLVILTVLVYAGLVYYQIVVRFFGSFINKTVLTPLTRAADRLFSVWWVSGLAYLLVTAGLVAFLVYDSWEELERLVSLAGIAVILFLGFFFSAHPGHVRWRHVFWGVGLQFFFGFLVLRWEVSE